MKNTLLLIFLFCFQIIVKGQDTIYLSYDDKEVEKEIAKQYVIIHKLDSFLLKYLYSIDNILKSSVHYNKLEPFVMNGRAIYYYPSGKISSEGYYNNSKRDSIWLFYHENGSLSAKVGFREGKIIEIYESLSDDGKELEGFPFDKKPDFSGGTNEIVNYISKELNYPKRSKINGIEGKVVIGFTIDLNGNILNCHIVSGINEELNEEALRVINNMPQWSPGIQFNRRVDVNYVIPIIFKL